MGNMFLGFTCAISNQAKTSIITAIKAIFRIRFSGQTLETLAATLNPKIRGWVNYYTKFARREGLREYVKALYRKYESILEETPDLFYHWKPGVK
jgi:RNA-directed DNA polymerase